MPYDYRLEEIMEPYCDVHWICKMVSDRYPPYQRVHSSFLFAMHGPLEPIIIRVPVDVRDGQHPTIDDLDAEWWIRPSAAQRNTIDLTTTRKYFSSYPITGIDLPFPCTILFEDQNNRQGTNRTMRQMRLSDSWKGNLIVVKNEHEEEYAQMAPEDEGIVIELVKQVMDAKALPIVEVYEPK